MKPVWTIPRWLRLSVALLALVGGCGGEDHEETARADPFTMSLAEVSVSPTRVELALTASFSGSAPLWKDGRYHDDIGFQARVPSHWVDTQVTSGVRTCYQVGGYALFFGAIWSNVVCVVP